MKVKRLLMALLICSLAVWSFSGCKKGEQQTDQAAEPVTGSTGNEKEDEIFTSDENAEITILIYSDNIPKEDNIVLQELESKTNTKINFIVVTANDYSTKLQTLLASDQVPDIFICQGQTNLAKYKESGIVANIESIFSEKMPNVEKEVKDIVYKVPENTDGIYMIPSPVQSYGVNINLRTDWLENLGLEVPTDLESFRKVMNAFTYDDPDGNGIDDTYGYTFNMEEVSSFMNLYGAFNIPKEKNIELEDGTVTRWIKHPDFLEAVRYIRTLIDDKVVEPDFVTIPNMNMYEKLWTGIAGCIEFTCVGPTNNWMPGRYTESPPPTFGFPVIKGPDGYYGNPASYSGVTDGYVFSAETKNMEGLARIANFCMSEEGSDLLLLGVEDVMYRWVDKEAGELEYLGEYTDPAVLRANGATYGILFQPKEDSIFRTLNEQTREGVRQARENGIEYANVLKTPEVETEFGEELTQIEKEMITDLYTTSDDIEAVYKEYINKWNEAGGTKWEQEITQLWKEQNEQ